jgi:transcriptional regulator with XRE-family HTH domain
LTRTWTDWLQDQLHDPGFAKSFDDTRVAVEFGALVRSLRDREGLSQRQLGERVGMRQTAVARLEAGAFQPTLRTIRRMAAGLGVGFTVSAGSVVEWPGGDVDELPPVDAAEQSRPATHRAERPRAKAASG